MSWEERVPLPAARPRRVYSASPGSAPWRRVSSIWPAEPPPPVTLRRRLTQPTADIENDRARPLVPQPPEGPHSHRERSSPWHQGSWPRPHPRSAAQRRGSVPAAVAAKEAAELRQWAQRNAWRWSASFSSPFRDSPAEMLTSALATQRTLLDAVSDMRHHLRPDPTPPPDPAPTRIAEEEPTPPAEVLEVLRRTSDAPQPYPFRPGLRRRSSQSSGAPRRPSGPPPRKYREPTPDAVNCGWEIGHPGAAADAPPPLLPEPPAEGALRPLHRRRQSRGRSAREAQHTRQQAAALRRASAAAPAAGAAAAAPQPSAACVCAAPPGAECGEAGDAEPEDDDCSLAAVTALGTRWRRWTHSLALERRAAGRQRGTLSRRRCLLPLDVWERVLGFVDSVGTMLCMHRVSMELRLLLLFGAPMRLVPCWQRLLLGAAPVPQVVLGAPSPAYLRAAVERSRVGYILSNPISATHAFGEAIGVLRAMGRLSSTAPLHRRLAALREYLRRWGPFSVDVLWHRTSLFLIERLGSILRAFGPFEHPRVALRHWFGGVVVPQRAANEEDVTGGFMVALALGRQLRPADRSGDDDWLAVFYVFYRLLPESARQDAEWEAAFPDHYADFFEEMSHGAGDEDEALYLMQPLPKHMIYPPSP